MKIYYIEEDILKYLLSYVETYCKTEIEAISLNNCKTDEIENSEKNLILISSTSLYDMNRTHEVLKKIKIQFPETKIRIILGGSMHYILNNEDFLNHYTQASHICVGKGEEFLRTLIDKKVPKGVHFAEDFGNIKPYRINKKYRIEKEVKITFNDNRCDWQKCLFCHHQTRHVCPINTAEKIAEDVEYYIKECNYKHFYFYDNNMNPHVLNKFLKILLEKGLNKYSPTFYLFGLRVDSQFEVLTEILEQWKPSPIVGGSWGLEFYDQEILDLYNKNTKLKQIDNALAFFHKYGIANDAYLLLGLPGVNNKHIEHFKEFIDHKSYLVRDYRVSFFLLNPFIRMYEDKEKFKMHEKNYLTLQDFFLDKINAPKIRTIFKNFDSWDEDLRRYVDRGETLRKYFPILKHKKMKFHPNMFLLDDHSCNLLTSLRLLGEKSEEKS